MRDSLLDRIVQLSLSMDELASSIELDDAKTRHRKKSGEIDMEALCAECFKRSPRLAARALAAACMLDMKLKAL